MTIIHIETSTTTCSVAISRNSEIVFSESAHEGLNHASLLSPFIQHGLDMLRTSNLSPDAVAISSGPGSYTGLRIGVSTAKGLCYGFNIPLIALDTLQIMAVGALKTGKIASSDALLCPMIDARRMEVYTAIFDGRGAVLEEPSAKIIDEHAFRDILHRTVYFFGNGADKCRTVITHPNSRFITGIEPLAENMIEMAEQKFIGQTFADTAYFEPFYLKEFQATTPKKVF